jgi:hypothetical protein
LGASCVGLQKESVGADKRKCRHERIQRILRQKRVDKILDTYSLSEKCVLLNNKSLVARDHQKKYRFLDISCPSYGEEFVRILTFKRQTYISSWLAITTTRSKVTSKFVF